MIKFININVDIYKNDDLKIIDKKERKKLIKFDLKFCVKICKYQLFINNLEKIYYYY